MNQQLSRNEDKQKWLELRLNQETTINTICQYLITAGVLLPEEQERYKAVLRGYDAVTTVKVLLTSWQLKESIKPAE